MRSSSQVINGNPRPDQAPEATLRTPNPQLRTSCSCRVPRTPERGAGPTGAAPVALSPAPGSAPEARNAGRAFVGKPLETRACHCQQWRWDDTMVHGCAGAPVQWCDTGGRLPCQ